MAEVFSKNGGGILQRMHLSFSKEICLRFVRGTIFLDVKATSTLVEPDFKFGGNLNCKSIDKDRYQRLFSLLYISHTEPNIAFNMSLVSQLCII